MMGYGALKPAQGGDCVVSQDASYVGQQWRKSSTLEADPMKPSSLLQRRGGLRINISAANSLAEQDIQMINQAIGADTHQVEA